MLEIKMYMYFVNHCLFGIIMSIKMLNKNTKKIFYLIYFIKCNTWKHVKQILQKKLKVQD
jgi:hypothetical protein